MASISSVITGGFGTPGSASLVITDGFGTAGVTPTTALGGRRVRRSRRPLWHTRDEGKTLDPVAVRQEAEYVAALAAQADMFALLDEQRVLQEALTIATARQRKTISAMINTIERRVAEIEDDEAAIVLIM